MSWITLFRACVIGTIVLGIAGIIEANTCNWENHLSEPAALKRLKPLMGKQFTVTDSQQLFSYHIGICTPASVELAQVSKKVYGTAGIVQTEYEADAKGEKRMIVTYTVAGLVTKASVTQGTHWVMLTYEGGHPYDTHCNKEERRSVIMIFCNRRAKEGIVRVLPPEVDRKKNCFHMFEIEHSAICQEGAEDLTEGAAVSDPNNNNNSRQKKTTGSGNSGSSGAESQNQDDGSSAGPQLTSASAAVLTTLLLLAHRFVFNL